MKSKIIYFVLYLVVIAELLVVIHERDILIRELKIKQDIEKYIQPVILDTLVNKESFAIPSSPGSMYNVLYVRNLVSREEKINLKLIGKRVVPSSGSEGYLPEVIGTENPETRGNIKLYKKLYDSDVILFRFSGKWGDFPIPPVGGKTEVSYDVYAEVRRTLPSELQVETIDKILAQIDTLKKDEIKFSYINGLTDSLLIKVIKITENPEIYSVDGFDMEGLKATLSGFEDFADKNKCASIIKPYRDAIKKFEFIKTNTVRVSLFLKQ